MNIQPGLKRWYGGGGALAFTSEGEKRAFIRTDVQDKVDSPALIETRDEDCLEFRAAEENKCLIGTQNKFEQWCGGQNGMEQAEVSSRLVESGNNACAPGMPTDYSTFFWLPDDPLPWARWKT